MSGHQIGYRRVSTLIQNEERQLDGIVFDEIFTDKASGRDRSRPQLKACLKYCRRGDTLHIHSVDRLARSLKDLQQIVEELVDRGITVNFHKEGLVFDGNDNAMSTLMLQVMGACAQFELSMINERRREGQQIAKKNGKHIGRKPTLNGEHVKVVKSMLAECRNKKEIAESLGVSRVTLYKFMADQGLELESPKATTKQG